MVSACASNPVLLMRLGELEAALTQFQFYGMTPCGYAQAGAAAAQKGSGGVNDWAARAVASSISAIAAQDRSDPVPGCSTWLASASLPQAWRGW